MKRYKELIELVNTHRPNSVLEVGTWDGMRAIELCQWGASYTGFDLFEEADKETDYLEKNVKPHKSKKSVESRLKSAGLQFELIKGNTNKTLPNFKGGLGPYDFAFIDGGHSVDTIASDWKYVKDLMSPGSVVVFDDYYEDMKETDLKNWGCNSIVNNMEHYLSEAADKVSGGGLVRLAIVTL